MKTEEQRLLDDLYDRETRTGWTYKDTSIKLPKVVKYPDPRKHQIISFIKSGLRIVACIIGSLGYWEWGFFGLGIAEVVGVVEELV